MGTDALVLNPCYLCDPWLELLGILFDVSRAEEHEAQAPQARAVVGDALEVQAGRTAEYSQCGPKARRPQKLLPAFLHGCISLVGYQFNRCDSWRLISIVASP